MTAHFCRLDDYARLHPYTTHLTLIMEIQHHALLFSSAGTQRALTSLHFGRKQSGQKIYIQAALHADEVPGMLVAHHLKEQLQILEPYINGEIVLVPMANPIGLDQVLMQHGLGRFEQASGENFNRHYPDFFQLLKTSLIPQLTDNASQNRRLIRSAIGQYLRATPVRTELDSLRQTLLLLAHDADVVLDLHCDFEAVLHLYVEHAYLSRGEVLAQFLRAQTVLWARGFSTNQGFCFDEALSSPWWQLAQYVEENFKGAYPIPLSCLSSTIELRGEADVSHANAQADCQHFLDYFRYLGVLEDHAVTLPELSCPATPLAGVETIYAPHSGIIVFHCQVGQQVTIDTVIAEIINPYTSQVSFVKSTIEGCLFVRQNDRFAQAHQELGKIAGQIAFRQGNLLSA